MTLSKRYLKNKEQCRVTFRLPKGAVHSAESVFLVGEFNDWSRAATPMQRLKSGEFKAVVDLTPGRAYQFRYLIDQRLWENDGEADRYVRSDYGNCDNSVVAL